MDEFFKTRGRMRVKINTEKNKIMYLSIDGLSVSEFEIQEVVRIKYFGLY